MSDFVKNIVKLAREYRASEQDARFSSKRTPQQNNIQNVARQEAKQKLLYIRDKFLKNPQIKEWHLYSTKRIHMHHAWGDHNVEICELVKSSVNRNAINSIIQKLSAHNYNIEDILDAENQDLTTSQLSKKLPGFSRRQIDIIDEILSTLPKSPEDHMGDQKQTNKTEIPPWDKMIELLGETTTIRDFFVGLRWAFTSYSFTTKDYNDFKKLIIQQLEQFTKTRQKGNPKPRKRL